MLFDCAPCGALKRLSVVRGDRTEPLHSTLSSRRWLSLAAATRGNGLRARHQADDQVLASSDAVAKIARIIAELGEFAVRISSSVEYRCCTVDRTVRVDPRFSPLAA
jgi:hypothetical protein